MAEEDPNAAGEDAGTLRTRFEADLAVQKRENALLRAGIDLDSPTGRMFAKGYDGDLDIAKIKEAWDEVAPAKLILPGDVPPPSSTAPVTSTEREVITGNTALADDNVIVDPESAVDPNRAAVGAYYDALKAGKRAEEAETNAFNVFWTAAVKGDQRVLLPAGRQGSGEGPY